MGHKLHERMVMDVQKGRKKKYKRKYAEKMDIVQCAVHAYRH